LRATDNAVSNRKRESGRLVSPLALIILALLVTGGGLVWWMERTERPAEGPPVLTPEAKAYVRNLQLSNVGIQAKEALVGSAVVEIVGEITNNGDRDLSLVEVNCVFYDPYSQVVLRTRVPIVSRRMGGLKPGETKVFRMPFDEMPESWNQDMPQLVIARIEFS
jgi:hypothetical protein